MKKRWRDQAQGKERLSVTIGVQERAPGAFFGVVPLEWMRKLSANPQDLEPLLADLAKTAPPEMAQVERDPQSGAAIVLGPVDSRAGAEAFATSMLQMICDELGISRDGGPEVRSAADGFFADFNTSRRTRPDGPPADLAARLARAAELARGDDDALTLVLAGWAKLKAEKDPHHLELVQLARAAVQWAPVREVPQTELGVLEARARHLAHLIAQNISPADQFVLLLCNTGEDGSLTHIGSMDRATIIDVVGEFVGHLRADAERMQ